MNEKEKCPRCDGRGFKLLDLTIDPVKVVVCKLCRGREKVDWIETIVGVSSSSLIFPKSLEGRLNYYRFTLLEEDYFLK